LTTSPKNSYIGKSAKANFPKPKEISDITYTPYNLYLNLINLSSLIQLLSSQICFANLREIKKVVKLKKELEEN